MDHNRLLQITDPTSTPPKRGPDVITGLHGQKDNRYYHLQQKNTSMDHNIRLASQQMLTCGTI
jgi:hypothetical protein